MSDEDDRVTEELSDAKLWLGVQCGIDTSFALIYDRYQLRVYRKAYSRLLNRSDAEDAAALCFLEAWRLRDKVRVVDGSVLPWLLTITTNVCYNLARARRRHRIAMSRLPLPADQPDHAPSVGDRLDSTRRLRAMNDVLRRLSASERRVIELCVVEEYTYAAASRVLGMPLGTIKTHLHRGRKKIAAALMNDGPASPEVREVDSGDWDDHGG